MFNCPSAETPRPLTQARRRLPIAAAVAVVLLVAIAGAYLVFDHAAERAKRHACAKTLSSIGQAMLLYQQENRSEFPATLAVLLEPVGASELLVCPWSKNTHLYWAGGLKPGAPPDTVIACEPVGSHPGGAHVLFADAHIEFVSNNKLKTIIAELQSGHNPPRAEMVK